MNFIIFLQLLWEQDVLGPILYDVISVLVLIILFIFFGLFSYRLYQLRKKESEEQQRKKYEAVIFAYLDEKKSQSEVRSYLETNPQHISTFIEICLDLLKNLEGEMEYRIKILFTFDLIQNHFKRKLNSRDMGQIANALFFFRHNQYLDPNIVERIHVLIQDKDVDIAFAAALALVDSKKMPVQFRALKDICRREEITKIAILELLLMFSKTDEPEFDERGKKIIQLIRWREIPLKFKLVLIKGMGSKGFITQAPALFSLLEAHLKDSEKPNRELVCALTEALGELNFTEALPIIKKLIKTGNKAVCISCAKALGSIGSNHSIDVLEYLFKHPEREVRHEAMNQMLRIGEFAPERLQNIDEKDFPKIKKNTLREITEIRKYQYD